MNKAKIMKNAQEKISNLYSSCSAALASGDIDKISMYYSTDAIQLPPDSPPLEGWKEIGQSLERELDGITFDSTLEIAETVVVEDCAYVWGSYRATITQHNESKTMTSGSFLDVLRLDKNGNWKIVRSTWSNHSLE